jgi:hypothetical protein
MTTPEDVFYNANIPLVDTTFDQWQKLFLSNFDQMERSFKINHVPLDDPSLTGNHTIVQLVEQASDLKMQTNIGDFAAFTRDVSDQTDQVFMQYQGNGKEFQYTNYQIYSVPDIKNGNLIVQKTYFTTLPGKIIVCFGSLLSSISLRPAKVTVKLFPPVIKNIISINTTIIRSSPVNSVFQASPIQNTSKKFYTSVDMIYSSNANNFFPFYYLIIGNL